MPRERLFRLAVRCAFLAGGLLALSGAPAAGQASVELKASSTEATVNESVTLELTISNFTTADDPVVPDIPRCKIVPGGSQSSEYIVNGRRWVQRTQRFELTARNAERVVVPPFKVRVDGKMLETEPLTISFRASEESDELLIAEITGPGTRLFVGQSTSLTLTIWVKPAKAPNGRSLSEQDMLECIRGARGSYGPFGGARARSDRRTRQTADGSSALYYTYELTIDYTCQQPGPLPFDDIEVTINYPIKFSTDPFFGDLRISRYRSLRTSPIVGVPDVLPLPGTGRPPGFTGAVGEFSLDAEAKPTQLRVGDPIELSLSISGDGALETLPGPNLAQQPALTSDFRVPEETLAGRVAGNRKYFSQVIRPKRDGIAEIPPIEFAYFDPERGEYAIAKSTPIPITVRPAERLDSSALADLAPSSDPQSGATEAVDGLRGNRINERELLAVVRPVSMNQVLAVTLAPPAAVALSWGCIALARTRSKDSARRRRHGAWAGAMRRLDAAAKAPVADQPREIEAAVAGYLADRFDQPPARMSGIAGVEFLQQRGIGDDMAHRLAELIGRCDQAVYAGGTSAESGLLDEARDCLRLLESQRQ